MWNKCTDCSERTSQSRTVGIRWARHEQEKVFFVSKVCSGTCSLCSTLAWQRDRATCKLYLLNDKQNIYKIFKTIHYNSLHIKLHRHISIRLHDIILIFVHSRSSHLSMEILLGSWQHMKQKIMKKKILNL